MAQLIWHLYLNGPHRSNPYDSGHTQPIYDDDDDDDDDRGYEYKKTRH